MKSNIDIKTSNQNIEYFDAIRFMEKKVEKILDNKENEMLWFLNHNHIYTCGTSANKNEIYFKPILQFYKLIEAEKPLIMVLVKGLFIL